MGNQINKDSIANDSLEGIINTDSFVDLNPEVQVKIIDSLSSDKVSDGGFIGKLLGANKENAIIHIGFIIICIFSIVLIAEVIYSFFPNKSVDMELLQAVFPLLSLTIGYVFGKSTK